MTMRDSQETQRLRDGRAHERGFILMTSYLLLAVLSILSLAMLSRSFFFVQATERNQNRMIAFNQAESGIDYAISQLAVNPDYDNNGSYAEFGTNAGYSIQICPPSCDGLEDSEPSNSNVRLISAIGYAPGNDSEARAYESRKIYAYVGVGTAGFNYAAFGDSYMKVNGNPMVDSYSASKGDYNENGNIGSSGDIASDDGIDLVGNATINGDVFGKSVDAGNNVTINGQTSNSTPNMSCEPGSTDVASSGDLSVNDEYKLSAGTYHFDSIKVSGQGQITVTSGPVVIYVDGDADFSGQGIINETSVPSNLVIIATDDGEIKISGQGEFHGGVFAPNSEVKIAGNGDLYGAVIADEVQQSGNANIHYDTDLAGYALNCDAVTLLSWKEQGTLLQGE